jgi:hypothetical protein
MRKAKIEKSFKNLALFIKKAPLQKAGLNYTTKKKLPDN